MSRRKFNKEFKVAAVKLVLEDELPVSQVAQQLLSASEQSVPLGERV